MARPKKYESKQEYDNLYIKNNKDRINFLMDRGTKDRIKLAASKVGQTPSEFIREAIEKALFDAGIPKKIAVDDPALKENTNK